MAGSKYPKVHPKTRVDGATYRVNCQLSRPTSGQ